MARWAPEPAKTSGRSDFARDRARLLHCAALRRLGAKTQVRTPWRRSDHPVGDDFIRTRLTHSLEVAQVGRELAGALGCDPDVVDTACLAHDLGHPPFGHNGERALASVARDIGGFEGNAQTLRLLTRLEAKVFWQGRSVGLNLTRASLDATIKYPWSAGQGPPGSAATKFGYFDQESQLISWLRQGIKPAARCVEAQVMDLADDIAYCVHDVEDGVVGGSICPLDLAQAPLRQAVVELAMQNYAGPSVSAESLDAAALRLVDLDFWVASWDGTRQALAGLKNMTSQLIGRFCLAVVQATRQRFGLGQLTRYRAQVIAPDQTWAEICVLKAWADYQIMQPRLADPVYLEQREIIVELFRLLQADPERLEPEFYADFCLAENQQAQGRVIVDQVASLTDASALLLLRHLTGG